MNNVRRISRQLIAYGTADVMALAVNFLLLPIYTRVLSPHDYGALALLLVCEAFLKVIYRWGLDTSFLRFYYDCHTEEERQTLASTIAGFWAAVDGTLLVVLLVAARPINRLLFDSVGFVTAYRLLVINTFGAAFLFLPLSLLRIQERARWFAALTFLRSAGTVVVRLTLVVGLGFGVTGLMLADVIITALLLVILGRTLRSMLAWRFSRAVLRELLRYALPRVPHGLLTQTMGMADRFLLGLYMPLREVGLYLIANTVAAVIKFYPAAFEMAWMPFAFDSMRRPDARQLFARMATYACLVLGFLALAIAGLSASIVELMLPADYHAAGRIVPVLAVGMTIQSLAWFVATSLNIAKQTRAYPAIAAVGATATIGANVLLIPRFGMLGAALALVVSQTLATGTTLYFAQRAYAIPYEARRLLKLVGVGLGTYAAMVIMPAFDPWHTLSVRAGLLGLFPFWLFLIRFFQPHEMKQIREFLRSVIDRRRPSAVSDLKVSPTGSPGRPLSGPGL